MSEFLLFYISSILRSTLKAKPVSIPRVPTSKSSSSIIKTDEDSRSVTSSYSLSQPTQHYLSQSVVDCSILNISKEASTSESNKFNKNESEHELMFFIKVCIRQQYH